MKTNKPERLGDILPRVLNGIRPNPKPCPGSLREALADWFAGKEPKPEPDKSQSHNQREGEPK